MKFSTCTQNPISGNEIQYKLEPSICPLVYQLDTTGILDLWDMIPPTSGLYSYDPDAGHQHVFRGIALWVSTGGTARTLLHVWEEADFTPGDILDYTATIKGYAAPGVAREIFFTLLYLTGNGSDPLTELPTQPVIETSNGAIGVSNIDNINAAIEYYQFIAEIRTPPFTFIRWANDMGTLTIGDVNSDAAKTTLKLFMASLPPPSLPA